MRSTQLFRGRWRRASDQFQNNLPWIFKALESIRIPLATMTNPLILRRLSFVPFCSCLSFRRFAKTTNSLCELLATRGCNVDFFPLFLFFFFFLSFLFHPSPGGHNRGAVDGRKVSVLKAGSRRVFCYLSARPPLPQPMATASRSRRATLIDIQMRRIRCMDGRV